MADPQPPASGAAADLESKEIWGDEADQLDEEIMKVQQSSSRLSSAWHSGCTARQCGCIYAEGSVRSVRRMLFGLISTPKV